MADDFPFENEERPEEKAPNPFGEDEELSGEEAQLGEREVKVHGVFEQRDEMGARRYVVLLQDTDGRSVPIWIGKFEAMAISLALEGASADRPLPYDMFNNVINKMGGTVDRVLVDDLWNDTYYAKISISHDGGGLDVDSRPSDAIALALRAHAPIYMAEAVLQKAAVKEE